MENRAKILTPVDTGRLRASISSSLTITGYGLTSRIGTAVDYAPYVHEGTRPHVIRPRTRQVLRFRVGSRWVYAREVHHPGTRARPFLERALREVAAQEGWQYQQGSLGGS